MVELNAIPIEAPIAVLNQHVIPVNTSLYDLSEHKVYIFLSEVKISAVFYDDMGKVTDSFTFDASQAYLVNGGCRVMLTPVDESIERFVFHSKGLFTT